MTIPALITIAGVVALAALDIVPIVVSAIAGALVMPLAGILTPKDAYNAINWQVILLLAGLIPLGTALAIDAAQSMGVAPRPFIFAVTFAASASFLTPVGYQTNTLIYGAGQFRFGDFVKVGTPLTLLFWGLATVLIPIIWPL